MTIIPFSPFAALVTVLSCAALAFQPPAAHAASANWTGGGTNALWSNTANWSAAPVPGTGEITQPEGIRYRSLASLAHARYWRPSGCSRSATSHSGLCRETSVMSMKATP